MKGVKMASLYEKYRPSKWSEVVGQNEAMTTIKRIVNNGIGGRAFWIAGISGSGKTTIARLLAKEIADDMHITEFDSAEGFTAEAYADIEQSMYLYGSGKGGRAYIINEAHGLRSWMIRRLLGLLERLPNHVVFIFTTTKAGQAGLFEAQIDAEPLLSRCLYIPLRNDSYLSTSFGHLCQRIARKEKMDGRDIKEYINLAKESNNNCRKMLQTIEVGWMS